MYFMKHETLDPICIHKAIVLSPPLFLWVYLDFLSFSSSLFLWMNWVCVFLDVCCTQIKITFPWIEIWWKWVCKYGCFVCSFTFIRILYKIKKYSSKKAEKKNDSTLKRSFNTQSGLTLRLKQYMKHIPYSSSKHFPHAFCWVFRCA